MIRSDQNDVSVTLKWLRCPMCHQALALEPSGVRCAGCARLFPVVDGIPVLLAERAS